MSPVPLILFLVLMPLPVLEARKQKGQGKKPCPFFYIN